MLDLTPSITSGLGDIVSDGENRWGPLDVFEQVLPVVGSTLISI